MSIQHLDAYTCIPPPPWRRPALRVEFRGCAILLYILVGILKKSMTEYIFKWKYLQTNLGVFKKVSSTFKFVRKFCHSPGCNNLLKHKTVKTLLGTIVIVVYTVISGPQRARVITFLYDKGTSLETLDIFYKQFRQYTNLLTFSTCISTLLT